MTSLLLFLAVTAVAAAPPAPEEVSVLQRWLPSLVTVGGVVATAVVTAFRVGTKFNSLKTTIDQLRTELDELKQAVKEGFAIASSERKHLHAELDVVEKLQIGHGKDIEHQTKLCTERHQTPPPPRRVKAEQPGGL